MRLSILYEDVHEFQDEIARLEREIIRQQMIGQEELRLRIPSTTTRVIEQLKADIEQLKSMMKQTTQFIAQDRADEADWAMQDI